MRKLPNLPVLSDEGCVAVPCPGATATRYAAALRADGIRDVTLWAPHPLTGSVTVTAWRQQTITFVPETVKGRGQ